MSVRLIIMQQGETVARIEDYDGPIPRVGEYFFHPPLDDDGTSDLTLHGTGIAGSAKTVTYGIYTRPRNGEAYFTGRPVQVVEIQI
jgi:hypothetical protein